MTRLLVAPALALVLACGAQPPPAAPPPDPGLQKENESLRNQVNDLERRLAASEEREKSAAAEARAAEKLRKIDEKLEELKSKAPPPEPPARPKPRPRMPGPEKDVMYSLPVDGGLIDGPKNALVTIVVASEIACPYCKRVQPTLDQLRKDYGRDLRVVYQSRIIHPQQATDAAHLLCAATRQRKGRKLLDIYWTQYDVWRQNRDPAVLSMQGLLDAAKKLRLNKKRIDRDMASCQEQVKRQNERFKSLGVNGAPSFFINGQFLRGAQPLANFKKLVDAELVKAKALVKAGVSRKALYPSIVAFGKTSL